MNTGVFLIFRCRLCRWEVSMPLPRVSKKIVYLDQFVLSNIVKAKDARWVRLYDRLNHLAAMQLVVCPFSTAHQEESSLTAQFRSRLQDLYETIGGGVRFRPPHDIELAQLLSSIRKWLRRPESSGPDESWEEVFESDPHLWTADMTVYASFSTDEDAVSRLRHDKAGTHCNIQSLFEFWRQNPRRLDEDVAAEADGFARSMMGPYLELAGGKRFDPKMPPGWHNRALLVHWLACEVVDARPEEGDPVRIVQQFFESDAFRAVPFIDITCRLWATIAQQARNPKGPRQPKASDPYDISVVSTYARYCDAILVDNAFRALVSSGKIDFFRKNEVRFFSSNIIGEFEDYLNIIETGMSPEHRESLLAVHSTMNLSR